MKAALYARKSFGDKEGSRSSIEAQKEAIYRFCEAHNIEIVREYLDDGVRGWKTDRLGLNAMLEDIRKKECPFQLIVVFEWDRLFRKYAEAEKVIEEVEANGLLTASAQGGIVSNKNEKIGQKAALFVAEIENLMRGEHVLAGQMHWASLGYTVGGRAPFGYQRAIVEDEQRRIRFRYEVDAKEAAVVKQIYKMRAGGKTITSIAAILNQQNIPSPEGKQWSHSSVWKILYTVSHQDKYLGNMLFNTSRNHKQYKKVTPKAKSEWIRCKGSHQAILTEEIIKKVNKLKGEK